MLGGALATWFIEDGLHAEQDAATERYDAATRYCRTPRCVELDGERATFQLVNNVLLFGGIAVVTGATVWYVITQLRAPERAALGWNFQLTPSPTGVLFGVRGVL
jgi:hypothetical protein